GFIAYQRPFCRYPFIGGQRSVSLAGISPARIHIPPRVAMAVYRICFGRTVKRVTAGMSIIAHCL
ncbi:MAG TPA: hypothetical protein VGS41_15785, partial [Chthonomonadales bacterium]|nr:hypothetical protein [Chthonomonadales bacterium]